MTKTSLVQALHARGYDVSRYRQWFDTKEGVVQFPLYDFRGQLAGYQTYRPGAPKQHANPKQARYFTRARRQLCWGTYVPLNPGPVFITEAIFKSTALHEAGFNSWAVMGSNVGRELRQQLSLLPVRFICIGDDDSAGVVFSKTFRIGLTSPIDLDEMSVEAIRRLVSEVSHD